MTVFQMVIVYLTGFIAGFILLSYDFMLEFDEMELGDVFMHLILSVFSWISALTGLIMIIGNYITHAGISKIVIFKKKRGK